jgi:hypothetical protein
MKMNHSYIFPFSIFLLACLFFNSCDDDPSFDPEITITENKITSKYLNGFGEMILTDKDHVLIRSTESIQIFKLTNNDPEFVQSIDFANTSGIFGMSIDNSTLAFGLAEANGTGKVFIYERQSDSWIYKQELAIGRSEDLFGSAIDICGENMIIGASAPWVDYPDVTNAEEGRIYFYRKVDNSWKKELEFLTESSKANDRFGSTVAIHENIAIAGSPLSKMHIYKLDNEWVLDRTEDFNIHAIVHHEDNFMIYTDNNNSLLAFQLEQNGNFLFKNINSTFNDDEIASQGEIINIYKDHALVNMQFQERCHLLNFANEEWNDTSILEPAPGESCFFYGIEISDQQLFLGGRDNNAPEYAYVYIRNY